ncbi:MAG: prephenate dehydrogenase/arogenate dehydrogenase family protein [Gammaproteobacteria bacterium]
MTIKLCIFGVGLIGGSFARALKQAGKVSEITGCSRNADHLQKAVSLGVIDRYETDPAKAVADADVIFISVPLGAIKPVLASIKGHIKKGAIITDAGSAKACVVQDIEAVFSEIPDNFVPGHPIAGTENSGVEASFAALYQNRRVILTPLENTSRPAIETITALWQATGAHVSQMTVAQHDDVLAATSHLPHVLAFTLVESLSRLNESSAIFTYAAGGFRDFTRIASSDSVMWRDICLANKSAIISMIESFDDDLSVLKQALQNDDGEKILALFTSAKQARDDFIQQD